MPKAVYLNGMTCLVCQEGHYEGYQSRSRTRPCTVCGFVAPAKLSVEAFHTVIAVRDAIARRAMAIMTHE